MLKSFAPFILRVLCLVVFQLVAAPETIPGNLHFRPLTADIGEGLDEPKRVMKFKGMLDKFLQTMPDQPYLIGYHAAYQGNSILDHVRG